MSACLPVAGTISSRRGIRRFHHDPAPAPLLLQLLDLAVEIFSRWNLRARLAIAVRDPANREALSLAANGQRRPREVPVTPVFDERRGRALT